MSFLDGIQDNMSNTKKNHIVIFDFDGVILDSVALTFAYTKKIVPFYSESLHRKTHSNPLYMYAVRAMKLFTYIFKKISWNSVKDEYTRKKNESVPIYNGIPQMLKNISSQYFTAINTNAMESDSLPILKKFNIDTYFDICKTSDDHVSKTQKNKQILLKLNKKPNQAIFITDTISDVLYAKEAGIRSIAVTWGVHTPEDFEKLKNDPFLFGIANTPQELEGMIHSYFRHE